jgi:hypothetical protein
VAVRFVVVCLVVRLLAVTPVDAEDSPVEEVDSNAELVAVGVQVGLRGGEPR